MFADVFCQYTMSSVQDLNMPLLLMWAKDDWITWFSGTKVYQENCHKLKLQVAEHGGHRILPEYLQPLLNFVER